MTSLTGNLISNRFPGDVLFIRAKNFLVCSYRVQKLKIRGSFCAPRRNLMYSQRMNAIVHKIEIEDVGHGELPLSFQ